MKRRYIFLVIFCLLVSFPFLYSPAKSLFLTLSEPILLVSFKTGSFFGNFFETVRSIKNLSAENQRLLTEIRKLESEKARIKEAEKENEILREQLGFTKSHPEFNLLPALVIGQGPNGFLEYLILNRGEKDGVKMGQAVILDGLLLGKIIEVTSSTSKVFLITNPTGAVPALIQDSRVAGLVKGQIGYGLILEDLPKEAEIKIGENVITSGLGSDFPKGLLIGQVEKIISKEAELFQRVSLKLLVDFTKLEMVFVIGAEGIPSGD